MVNLHHFIHYLTMENNQNDAVLALLARVRLHNKKSGTTLVDLADRTGMKANNISRMMQGKANSMRLDKFLQLLDASDLQISLKKVSKNK